MVYIWYHQTLWFVHQVCFFSEDLVVPMFLHARLWDSETHPWMGSMHDTIMRIQRRYDVPENASLCYHLIKYLHLILNHIVFWYKSVAETDRVDQSNKRANDLQLGLTRTASFNCVILYRMTTSKVYTLEECSKHRSEKDCWLIIYGKVYDVTKFLDEHPGGYHIVVAASGK